MSNENSLAALTEDVVRLGERLAHATDEKDWQGAWLVSKALLGIASRTFARLDGILKALEELDQRE